SPGYIVYALGGSLFARAFDMRRPETVGDPVAMIDGIRRPSGGAPTGAANFSISSSGSLIYIPGPVTPSLTQVDIAVTGRDGPVEPLKLPPRGYATPRVS